METYGTDAERRLGKKDKRVAARLSLSEVAHLNNVLKHLGVPRSIWVRHALLSVRLEAARITSHEVLRGRLLVFRNNLKALGRTEQLVAARLPAQVVADFTTLLTQLAPVVKPALGLRWALWEQGQLALQRPGKADLMRVYNAAHQQLFDPRNAAPPVDARPLTGYLSEGDIL